jgi:hypothetical protein
VDASNFDPDAWLRDILKPAPGDRPPEPITTYLDAVHALPLTGTTPVYGYEIRNLLRLHWNAVASLLNETRGIQRATVQAVVYLSDALQAEATLRKIDADLARVDREQAGQTPSTEGRVSELEAEVRSLKLLLNGLVGALHHLVDLRRADRETISRVAESIGLPPRPEEGTPDG